MLYDLVTVTSFVMAYNSCNVISNPNPKFKNKIKTKSNVCNSDNFIIQIII